MHATCSLWGRADHPGAEGALDNATLAGDTKVAHACTDFTEPIRAQIWPFVSVFNTGKMVPFYRLHIWRAPHRDNGAVPLVIALKPHNSDVPCMSPQLLSCFPSSRAQGECLQVNESVHRPFKWTFGFLAAFHLTKSDRQNPH